MTILANTINECDAQFLHSNNRQKEIVNNYMSTMLIVRYPATIENTKEDSKSVMGTFLSKISCNTRQK